MKHTIFILFLIHTLSFQAIYSAAQFSPSGIWPRKPSNPYQMNAHLRGEIQRLDAALAAAKSEKSILTYALQQTLAALEKTKTDYAAAQRENSEFQLKISILEYALQQSLAAHEFTKEKHAIANHLFQRQATLLTRTEAKLSETDKSLKVLAKDITREALPKYLADALHKKISNSDTPSRMIAEIAGETIELLTEALIETDLERRKAESRGALLVERPLQPRTAPAIISQYLRTGTIAQHPSGGGSIVRGAATNHLS